MLTTNSIIGIIGGNGRMAQLFIPVFEKHGFTVLISDLNTELSNEDLVKQADIVLISVPMEKTSQIIREIVPHTREGQLLLDFTSLKTAPMNEMLKGKAEVCGLHPMFGPMVTDLQNQTIVMCPVRTEHTDFLKNLFEAEGAAVHVTTPEDHDKAMSIVQVLIHFHSIVTGNVMKRLGVDMKEIMKYASPIYRLELSIVGRIFAQDPALYGSIEMMNPFSRDITKAISQETKELAHIVDTIDLKKFVEKFEETANFLADYKDVALKESSKLIKHL